MRILITNDDGIDTLGIRLLAAWARKLGEVTVVAPKVEQSAKSHAIELIKNIEIKEVPFMDGVKAYSMDSTPADCVRYGIIGLKQQYDLVLSGINRGINVGVDVVYSGTCGAVFEAARLGVKAIAFSAFPDGQEAASKYFDEVYQYFLEHNLFNENEIYNVNIPNEAKGIRMTYQGSHYYSDDFVPIEGEENMYRQDGEPIPDVCPDDLDRDTVAIHKGFITVTPLLTSRTNMEVFRKYQNK
ncbi:MAG: 5'/3'-nucleotidase SurE [Clostridia bacterium]|nr:5'/3'-nucleotidase SurE [Clostridia bacterium]